jgi:hypothetical protein
MALSNTFSFQFQLIEMAYLLVIADTSIVMAVSKVKVARSTDHYAEDYNHVLAHISVPGSRDMDGTGRLAHVCRTMYMRGT